MLVISHGLVNPFPAGAALHPDRCLEGGQRSAEAATRADGRLDEHKLGSVLVAEHWRKPELGGHPHADILITDQHLVLGDENWGYGNYGQGFTAISVPGTRQDSVDFISNIAKHEAGHLFGFPEHHDNCRDIPGYTQVKDCLMFWQASTRQICERCSDAIKYFWKGIENKTGQRFVDTF